MRAINSGVMKQSNRKMVLDCIRKNPISRAELADYTCLTRASITHIVDELMEDGLVVESFTVERNRLGRRQMKLEIVKNARCLAGVCLCRGGYDIGLVNLGGEVLWQRSGTIIGREAEDVLDEIAAAFRRALNELDLPHDHVCCLGVTAPGPLDPFAGIIRNPPNFEKWHNVPVASMLQQRTGWDAILANVSCAHALDELYFGIGREQVDNFALLRVDEGVGTGVIMNGRLFTGPRGENPEIGHIPLDANGPECACGNRGCLEQYVAFPAVLQGTAFTSWQQVMDQADSNPEAKAILRRVAGHLAQGMLSLLNLFNVDRIVLGGNFQHKGDRLCAEINDLLRGKGMHASNSDPAVSGNEMLCARIAAMPAFHQFFNAG